MRSGTIRRAAANRLSRSTDRQEAVFLTNNFTVPALIIAQLYRCRWQIELFFKWIKQHLRIKSFYGTSDNAVRTQVWIAIAVYLLVAHFEEAVEIVAEPACDVTNFEPDTFRENPVLQLFSDPDMLNETTDSHDQPSLPGFLTGQ